MRRTIQAGLLALLGLAAGHAAVAGGPMGWRNDGTGSFPDASPPSQWSAEKNVLWKAPMPGPSYGAPVVAGSRLFVVADPSELLCIERDSGKVLWRKSNKDVKAPAGRPGGFGGRKGGFGGRKGGRMGGAGNTAATPVSDGKVVAAVFGNGVVAAYDLEGKRLWAKFVEAPYVGFGHAASPLLIDGKLIVHIQDLVALDAATGKEAWRVSLRASHASPVAARVGKDDVVISPSGAIVRASDGKVLAKGAFRTTQASPVVSGNIVCVCGREGKQAVALSQDEKGGLKVKSLWERDSFGEKHQLPSPLLHDGLVYAVSTSGLLEVIDVKTGKNVYRRRLGLGQVYSSAALAGGLIYVADLRGKTAVFKPGRTFERVALNELEGTGSCPVFAGDHLYLRGRNNLYCVSAKGKGGT